MVLSEADASVSKLRAMGCKVEPLPIKAHSRNPWFDFLLFWSYLRLLRRYRPVALLSFTVKPNIYGGLAARLLGVPRICNVSGLGTAFIQGGWLGKLVQVLYRLGLLGAKTVFFQNPDDRDLFLAKCIVAEAQAVLLPGSGLDLQHFTPGVAPRDPVEGKFNSAEAPFVFLFVGRLLRDKGLLELVEALNLLGQENIPLSGKLEFLPRLLILGPEGGVNPTAILSGTLAQWRQSSQIELLGSTDDVRPFIAGADCVVLPSYREGTPRSLLEAAAMGKPLIATDVPGCRQVVQDGHNGYLCRVRDPHDLARAMRQLMQLSPEQRQAMGQASRKLAEELFDEKLVVKKYLEALSLGED